MAPCPVPDAFIVNIPGALGVTGIVIGGEGMPKYSTTTATEALVATEYGTTTLSCVLNVKMTGAGTPSNRTRVPASVVSNRPDAFNWCNARVSGPIPDPKMVMISPGEIAAGRKVAAPSTPVLEN